MFFEYNNILDAMFILNEFNGINEVKIDIIYDYNI